uniref:Putative capsid protein n=1 Tax=Sichuan rat gut-associated circular DNA virus 3 TaxID=2863988 RepID=A0A8K1HKF0_9VIRU|nr:putative capsid protein [Sichuan rat gut-associated circular DNA virus 3]
MAWFRRGRRLVRRRRRYRTFRRRFTFRRRRRVFRRSTSSSLVKLTYQTKYTFRGASDTYAPFSFVPQGIPGFQDYSTTYSQYRIVKARLQVSRVRNGTGSSGAPQLDEKSNVLVVPSRPMASLLPPVPVTASNLDASYMPALSENQLRQSRWQKQYYPNTTTQAVSIGFHPFTFQAAFAPTAGNTQVVYQRVWKGRNWTPMQWAVQQSPADYFGPYVVINGFNDEPSSSISVPITLTVYVQFRGQR